MLTGRVIILKQTIRHNLPLCCELSRIDCIKFQFLIFAAWAIWYLPISAQETAYTNYKQGIELLNQNQKIEALQYFQKAVDQDPNLANAHFLIGMLMKEKEKWIDARSALELAIVADPKYAASYIELAKLKINIFSQIPETISLLKKIVDASIKISVDNTVELRKWLGIAYFRDGQFQRAKTEFDTILTDGKFDPYSVYLLSLSLIQLGDFQKAERQLRVLVEKEPFHKKAHFSLGNLYRTVNQRHQSRQHLQQFQEIDLEDEKIIYLEQSIRANPSQASAWLELGRIYSRRQQWSVAVSILNRLLDLAPTNPVSHEVIGLCYLMDEHYQKASQHYQLAVELRPENATYRNSLGSVYLKMDCPKLAIQQLEIAAELEPQNEKIFNNLAIAYQQTDQNELAESTYIRYQKLANKQINSEK